MAKNDVVLLDGILQERQQDLNPSSDIGEVFELFAFEQVLKEFDLPRDALDFGWVDGRDDGGIDGFYIFVNGHLVQDPATFLWPLANATIEVRILTCKHHETFQQAPLNNLVASIPELFDFSLDQAQLRGQYSRELLEHRHILHTVMRKMAVTRPSLAVYFSYISRGDSSIVEGNVRARANQLESIVHELFSDCIAKFDFVGGAELIALYRKIKSFELELPILESVNTSSKSYIAVTRLDDYAKFVTDQDGTLRRYLFDSNVRDYLGSTGVNEDIRESLSDADAPDFWWLNNGVTILATSASVVGKAIPMKDIQIVNGLQTTETVFRSYHDGTLVQPQRGIMVKIIVTSEASIRDRIIRATNNQSLVEPAALRATDKIQRDIEDALLRADLYYERRTHYYRNLGKPASRFVTPLYLAAGCVSLVLKNPAEAARLTNRFMRSDRSYERVFNPGLPISVWVVIAETLKRVETALNSIGANSGQSSIKFASKWRYLIALLAVSKLLGRFSYGPAHLASFDVTKIDNAVVVGIWNLISRFRKSKASHDYRRPAFVQQCCAELSRVRGVAHPEAVGVQKQITEPRRKERKFRPVASANLELAPDFLDEVNAALPPQPWQPGVHLAVAQSMGRTTREVQAAIQVLIEQGRRYRQKDGVVYDKSGTVIAVDQTRAITPPTT